MKNKRVFIVIYMFIIALFIFSIVLFSWKISVDMKSVLKKDLFQLEYERFQNLEDVIYNVDDNAKKICLTQFFDADCMDVMLSEKYDVQNNLLVSNKLQSLMSVQENIHSICLYNGILDEYPVVTLGYSRGENTLEEIKTDYNGDIPKLVALPRLIDNHSSKVITYILYDKLNADGMPESGIVINFDISMFENVINSMNLGDSRILIIDSNNKVIVDTANIFQYSHMIDSGFGDLINSKQNTCELDGEKVIINSHIIKESNWKCISITNHKKFFHTINQLQFKITIISIIFIIITLFLAAYITSLIYIPICELLGKIKGISEGEMETNALLNTDMSSHLLLKPSRLISSRISAASSDVLKSFRSFFMEKKAVMIKNAVFYESNDNVDVEGRVILFKLCGTESKNSYMAWVFNMIRLYIEEYASERYDFVALDKSQVLAIVDMPENKIEKMCRTIIDDAELCNVVLSAYIGGAVTSSQQISNEYTNCHKMSRYQLMYDCGFVYDNEKYQKDENKPLSFNTKHLNDIIEFLIGCDDSEARKDAIHQYLLQIADNNVDNFRDICMDLINVLKKIYNDMIGVEVDEDYFSEISMLILCAETLCDIEAAIVQAADILNKSRLNKIISSESISARVDGVIRNNISYEGLSPSFIANELNCPQRQLSKSYKEETGISISESINRIRMLNVAEMLKSNRYTIKDIMQSNGYISESNFYKLFKQYYHVTPKEYQKYLNN